MSKETDVRKYLQSHVDSYLKQLLVDLIRIRPENVHEYIVSWLETTGSNIHEGLNPTPQVAPAEPEPQPEPETQPVNEEPVNPPTEEAPAPEEPIAE